MPSTFNFKSYGVGPRICSPELEKFIATALTQFEIKIDKLVSDHSKKIDNMQTNLNEMKTEHMALNSSFNVAKEQTLTEMLSIGRVAIEDIKDRTLLSANTFMENTAQSLKHHFDEEFNQQVKEGVVDRIKDMVKIFPTNSS